MTIYHKHTDLSVSVLVRLVDLDLHAVEGHAAAADLPATLADEVERVRARALAHAVQLHERDVDGHEEVVDVRLGRGGSHHKDLAAREAKLLTNLLEDKFLGD